jgi:outer membrane lipase/esterase
MKLRVAAAMAAILSLAISGAAQAAYTGLFIFGDSLSDPGNNAIALSPNITPISAITQTLVPTFPYPSLQYTNANVWAYQFAHSLGLQDAAKPILGGAGTNWAFGGARTGPLNSEPGGLLDPAHFPPTLLTQATTFVNAVAGQAPGTALYVVAGGGNNARDTLEAVREDPGNAQAIIAAGAAQYALDIGMIVDNLQAAGASDIVVWNTPNIGSSPAVSAEGQFASGLASMVATAMNQALAVELQDESVKSFDFFAFLTDVVAHPAKYGLSNATDACGALGAACDPSSYLFWDGIHPTSAGHRIIANAMFTAVVPEPSAYVLLATWVALLFVHGRRWRLG